MRNDTKQSIIRAALVRLKASIIGVLSAVLLSTGAQAAVVVGTLTGSPFSGGEAALFQGPAIVPGAFEQILEFTVDETIEFTASATPIEFAPVLSITGFDIALVRNTGTGFSTFDTLATSTTNAAGDLVLNFDGLFVGELYGVLFTGTADGISGGGYFGDYNTAVSNVPIPTALPLFLSSIVGLILIARRGKRLS